MSLLTSQFTKPYVDITLNNISFERNREEYGGKVDLNRIHSTDDLPDIDSLDSQNFESSNRKQDNGHVPATKNRSRARKRAKATSRYRAVSKEIRDRGNFGSRNGYVRRGR